MKYLWKEDQTRDRQYYQTEALKGFACQALAGSMGSRSISCRTDSRSTRERWCAECDMTIRKEKWEEGGEIVVLRLYGSMVKLPLVRIPLAGPPLTRVLCCVSDVGLVPQSITIWNVNDSPMSALVNAFVKTWLFNV